MPDRPLLAEAFFDAATTHGVLLDDELRCLLVSESFAAGAGLAPCAAEGRAFAEVFPELAAPVEPVLRLVLETGIAVRNLDVPGGAAGGPRWGLSAFPVGPGAGRRVGMSFGPASALPTGTRESLFHAVFEHAAVAMLVMEWHGKGLRMNPAFERMLGYSSEELTVVGVKGITHADDFALDLQQFRRMMAGEIDHYQLVKRYVRKDGSVMWGDLVVSIARDAQGEPDLVISTMQDVSERVRAEAALGHAQEQLFQARKMEAVGRLAGGVAHDFNNILSIVLSHSTLMLRGLAPDDPTRAHVLEVQKAGERAAAVTRQLLAFSRGQVLQRGVVDLDAIAHATEKMLRHVLGEDIELTVVSGASGRVIADAGQVEQILMNLALNARDAMPDGGRLTIETRDEDIDADYALAHPEVAAGRYVTIAVSDTGVGMDAPTRARIFEPFFTTKESGKGTGLGLATVFGIVKQSDGHISVRSEPGDGTTFEVYLPRTDATPAAVAPTVERDSERGDETVLLVEDDEQVRAVAGETLRSLGYCVLEAANAGEALLVCEQHPGTIHLLLTDVVLPRVNGRKLAERAVGIRPDMKVLFMSGYTDDAILRHGVLESEVWFLQKPITPAGLARKVRAVLGTGR